MWGTDLTSVMTGEGQAAVFIAVDHCSTECVGIHASRSADRFQALEPVRQAVRQGHGGFAKGIAAGLRLRHDHGSQYVSHDFQAEIRFLGIESSPAFVREPEGNGCAERFIRVLKENLLWVRRFDTVEELRLALLAFRQTYNQSWIIERHGYRTPAQVRADQITARCPWPLKRRAVSQNCGPVVAVLTPACVRVGPQLDGQRDADDVPLEAFQAVAQPGPVRRHPPQLVLELCNASDARPVPILEPRVGEVRDHGQSPAMRDERDKRPQGVAAFRATVELLRRAVPRRRARLPRPS